MRYLPERVLRQFGYVQYIPPPPPIFVTLEVVDEMWAQWEEHVLEEIELTPVGADPGECVEGYRAWYIRVSHPYMAPAAYKEHVLRQGHEHEDHVDSEPDGHGHEETYIEILEEVNDIAHELLMLNLGDVVDERLQRIRTLVTTRPSDGYRRRHRRRMDGGEDPSS